MSLLLRGSSPGLMVQNGVGSNTKIPVSPGSAIYVPPGQPHRIHWRGDSELINFYLSEEMLWNASEQNGCRYSESCLFVRPDRTLHEIARFLLHEFDALGHVPLPLIDHATALTAYRLLRISHPASDKPLGLLSLNRLQPAMDCLHSTPRKPKTLSELARLCNSSVFHFARSFTARVGCPPFVYQRKLAVEHASSLLTGTDLPIYEVARTSGMENPTHFARAFRRATGNSPSEFRRANREHP